MIDVGAAIFSGILTGILLVIVTKLCSDYSSSVTLALNGITFLSIFGITLTIFNSPDSMSETITVLITFIVTTAISGAITGIVVSFWNQIPLFRN